MGFSGSVSRNRRPLNASDARRGEEARIQPANYSRQTHFPGNRCDLRHKRCHEFTVNPTTTRQSGGRAVRRSLNVPRLTPSASVSRSPFGCLNDCSPIAQTYAERRHEVTSNDLASAHPVKSRWPTLDRATSCPRNWTASLSDTGTKVHAAHEATVQRVGRPSRAGINGGRQTAI